MKKKNPSPSVSPQSLALQTTQQFNVLNLTDLSMTDSPPQLTMDPLPQLTMDPLPQLTMDPLPQLTMIPQVLETVPSPQYHSIATTTVPTPQYHPGTFGINRSNNHLHDTKPTPVVFNKLRSRFEKASNNSKIKFEAKSAARSVDAVFNQMASAKKLITTSFIRAQLSYVTTTKIATIFKEMISTHRILKIANEAEVMTLLQMLNHVLVIIDSCPQDPGDFFADYNYILINHPDQDVLGKKKDKIYRYFRGEMLETNNDFSLILLTVVSLFFNLDPDIKKRLITIPTYMELTTYTILMARKLQADEKLCSKLIDEMQNVILPFSELIDNDSTPRLEHESEAELD